jgi:hypothetical protein
MISKIFKPGAIVKLFPGDSQRKVAEILEISDLHIVLRLREGTSEGLAKVGDVNYYPVNKVTMTLITPAE